MVNDTVLDLKARPPIEGLRGNINSGKRDENTRAVLVSHMSNRASGPV